MRISRIEYFRLDLPLSKPYTIAYETVEEAVNLIMKITTNTGKTGWGCAAPDKLISGESVEEMIRNLDKVIIPMLKGEDAFRMAYFHDRIKKKLPGARSGLALVDIALHDLLARKAELPLYQLLGGYRHKIRTSITLGIMPMEETLEEAARFWKNGFRILKLKGGIELEADIEKVFKLREQFGRSLVLRFDANQGYSESEAIQFIERTEKAGIEILEQPTPVADEKSLKRVSKTVPVPVMADESLLSLKDAYRLSRKKKINMINIKLMKVGGILEAQHINSVAKAAGMESMVGCLDECALGISAGLHFALSRPNIEYADLDGHLVLLDDPFTGLFDIRDGWVIPDSSPGLGRIHI